MRTAHFSESGVLLTETPPPGQRPPRQTVGTWDQDPVNRMTDASENITLPQTSFTGGNKKFWLFS